MANPYRYMNTAEQAMTPGARIALYNLGAYDVVTNRFGLGEGGQFYLLEAMLADMQAVGRDTGASSALAAAAASQQEAWGPTFTTAAGTVTFLTATTFAAAGDAAATFSVGSHVAADCGADGYRYGLVSGVSSTTVTVSLFAGVLTANLRRVYNAETKVLYLSDYIDLTAAVSSARASQDAALASQLAAASQSFRDLRDTLGAFPAVIRPTLNLHAGLVSNDDCPLGSFSRSSTKWRLGPTGLLESVAVDKVAREWDANGSLLGWPLEEQRTGRLWPSRDLTNSRWVTDGVTPLKNATGSDGAANAASTITATKDNAVIYQDYSASGSTRAMGVRIKRKTGSGGVYLSQDGGTTWSDVTSYLSSSTWYRASVVKTVSNPRCLIKLATSGDALYVDFFNIEDGSFLTSDIETVTAPVTRPADVWTIPVNAFPLNVYSGAFYVQGLTAKALPKSGIGQVLFMIDDGTWQNTLFMYRSSTGVVWLSTLVNGVNVGINCGTFANSTIVRAAVSYNASLIRVSINGGNVLSVAYSRPNGISMLRLGNDLALSQAWNGELLHFSYFPQDQSDAVMKIISS